MLMVFSRVVEITFWRHLGFLLLEDNGRSKLEIHFQKILKWPYISKMKCGSSDQIWTLFVIWVILLHNKLTHNLVFVNYCHARIYWLTSSMVKVACLCYLPVCLQSIWLNYSISQYSRTLSRGWLLEWLHLMPVSISTEDAVWSLLQEIVPFLLSCLLLSTSLCLNLSVSLSGRIMQLSAALPARVVGRHCAPPEDSTCTVPGRYRGNTLISTCSCRGLQKRRNELSLRKVPAAFC